MNKLKKFLKKIPRRDRIRILNAICLLENRKLFKLDLKKVVSKDYYRIRVGQYRITFKYGKKELELLSIGRKNDNSYK